MLVHYKDRAILPEEVASIIEELNRDISNEISIDKSEVFKITNLIRDAKEDIEQWFLRNRIQ